MVYVGIACNSGCCIAQPIQHLLLKIHGTVYRCMGIIFKGSPERLIGLLLISTVGYNHLIKAPADLFEIQLVLEALGYTEVLDSHSDQPNLVSLVKW